MAESSPTRTSEEVAFAAYRFGRERASGLVLTGMAIALFFLWVIVDRFLEPQEANYFLALRSVNGIVDVALLVTLLRSKSLATVRVCVFAMVLVIGGLITLMLPRATSHYFVYVLGFSLVFWGGGIVLLQPWRWALAEYTALVVLEIVSHATHPGAQPLLSVVGATTYVASAATLVVAIAAIRDRLDRRSFLLSFRLEQRNAELANALERLREAQARLVATEKQSALGRLLAGLSHEVNNPTNVIHNNVDPLREYFEELGRLVDVYSSATATLPEQERADVAAMQGRIDLGFVRADAASALDAVMMASDRIRRIHQDLRAFIRGDAPKMIDGDPTDGLQATVAMLRRNKPAAVTLDAELAVLPPIHFNPGQLNQVFFNVLQNAIDAVGERGKIRVTSRVDERSVTFEVVDDGPGISHDVRPHLFEMFFTTKGVGKGTGLGLATSREIVTAHGGTIEALTAEHGAHFVVRLPRQTVD